MNETASRLHEALHLHQQAFFLTSVFYSYSWLYDERVFHFLLLTGTLLCEFEPLGISAAKLPSKTFHYSEFLALNPSVEGSFTSAQWLMPTEITNSYVDKY